jgi:hypothetical protein
VTATTPPPAAGQPAVQPQPSGAAVATGVVGAGLLVGTRIALWLAVQPTLPYPQTSWAVSTIRRSLATCSS